MPEDQAPDPDDLGTWVDELVSLVRLCRQGRADLGDFRRAVEAIAGEQPGERLDELLVRALLCTAGTALADDDLDVYATARDLVGQCPESARYATYAADMLSTFDRAAAARHALAEATEAARKADPTT